MGENVFFVCFWKKDLLCQQQSEKDIFTFIRDLAYTQLLLNGNPIERPYMHLHYLSSVSVVAVVGWRVSKALWPKERSGDQVAMMIMEVFPQKHQENCNHLQNFNNQVVREIGIFLHCRILQSQLYLQFHT